MSSSIGKGALVGGRYRLREKVGEGGMAEVWSADSLGSEGFRKRVAVKRIHGHLASSDLYRGMFVREACLTAWLDHPNIVQVFDLGEDDTGLYLVMEWVEGVTLRDLATLCKAYDVRLSPAFTAAIGIELLHALEAAHGHTALDADGVLRPTPIVHRDISPSNVLLSIRGVIKLADFGLARALDGAQLTPDGMVKGKLAYLAPETIRGRPLGPASDLYGVGVLLWEALCGRRLFAGRTDGEIVKSLMKGEAPAPIRELCPAVPEGLARTVERALLPEPEARHPSASAFARAISDVLRGVPERTDATRIAREVGSAQEALRHLHANPHPDHADHGDNAVHPGSPGHVAPAGPPGADARQSFSELVLDDNSDAHSQVAFPLLSTRRDSR